MRSPNKANTLLPAKPIVRPLANRLAARYTNRWINNEANGFEVIRRSSSCAAAIFFNGVRARLLISSRWAGDTGDVGADEMVNGVNGDGDDDNDEVDAVDLLARS